MKTNKLKNIYLGFISVMFVMVFLLLVGCSATTTDSTITKLSSTMTMLSDTLLNIKTIESNELIIDDFMDDDELQAEFETLSTPNKPLYDYFSNITKLNNTIVSTVETNDMVTSSKINLVAKANQIKMLCSEIKREKVKLDNNKTKTLDEITTCVLSDINKIKLTKNEVNNNVINIDTIKKEYNSKTASLISKYNTLKSSLNTRLTYFLSVEAQLDSICEIINDDLLQTSLYYTPQHDINWDVIKEEYNDDKSDFYRDEFIRNQENSIRRKRHKQDKNNKDGFVYPNYNQNESNKTNKKNIDNYLSYEIDKEKQKSDLNENKKPSRFKKNIDTYEFAGRNNPYSRNRDNDTYYIQGGLNNGYYQMPYGYGMYNGFGYGMPFGYGYTYPNINTFRGIRNIDTYLKKAPINDNNLKNDDDQSQNEFIDKEY